MENTGGKFTVPRPKIVVQMPAGPMTLDAFRDSHDIIEAYRSKEIEKGNTIFYSGMICDVIGEFTDETGLVFPTLLAVSQLNGASFRVEMR